MMDTGTPSPLLHCETVPDEHAVTAWLRDLRARAYVPGSGYRVACVMRMDTPSGPVFAGGVNVECYEHRLNAHGEESAIAALATAFGKGAVIDAVWMMAAPGTLPGPVDHPLADIQGQACGNCRQQIVGLARSKDIAVTPISLNGRPMTETIGKLIPHSFSFADFDPDIQRRSDNARRDANVRGNPLFKIRRDGALDTAAVFDWLRVLESIDHASGIGQAVILHLDGDRHVAGVKVENAAYTGLNAVQSALSNAVTSFGPVAVRGLSVLGGPSDGRHADLVYPVTLAALQGLCEFIDGDSVPVRFFNRAGESVVLPLRDATSLLTRFAAPAYRLRGGALVAA